MDNLEPQGIVLLAGKCARHFDECCLSCANALKGTSQEIDRLRNALSGERAAIVAWLRSESGDPDDFATYAAEAIERGDHLKDSHPTPDAV